MLAIARGLARRPRLLLLDELSLGLAPVIVESLLPVVHQYALDSGCGVLLVEQHIQLALEVADRGYVLSHGEIVLSDRAKVLQADRELLISSYLGEQQVPIGETGTRPDSIANRLREAMMARFRVLNPEGYPPKVNARGMAPSLDGLDGKKLFLVDVGFANSDNFMAQLHGWFEDHRPTIRTEIVRWRNQHIPDPELCERIQADGDAAIIGVGT